MITFTKIFKNQHLCKALTIGTSFALILCCSSGAAAKTSKESSFDQQVLTRVDTISDSGYIQTHLEDANGTIYTDSYPEDNAKSEVTANQKLTAKKTANLPSSYDLRNYNYTTPIKDQEKSGCCWAFSAIKAIESNGIRTGLLSPENADLSESHLAWFSYNVSTDFNDPLFGDGVSAPEQAGSNGMNSIFTDNKASTYAYENGGSATLATFSLSRGSGPVPESDAPFSAASESSIQKMANFMVQKNDLRYKASLRLKNAICFDETTVGEDYYYQSTEMISEMKQAILEHGAMSVGFYYDKSLVKTTKAGTSYYQNYYTGTDAVKNANHAVTIIGWDDNYSRSNFSPRPSKNGAWLIANSYGTTFGDEGYFWLSYYDPSICDCVTFEMDSADTYQNIYQYDGFGWASATSSTKYDIKTANIFTAKTDSPQALQAVSFYTLTDDQKYTIQIYRDVTSKPTDGILIDASTTSGVLEQSGYYTIPLKTPVNVAAGEKFSVVLTYVQSGSKKVYAPFEGKDTSTSDLNIQYEAKSGQSYLYAQTTTSSQPKWMDLTEIGYNNVCVKVFANNTASADSVQAYVGAVTIGKGESYRLSSGSGNYSSADPSVATVSSEGIIRGVRAGKTTITLTSGISTRILDVNVKKAPSRIRIKPSGKKKVKKGKKFRIKVKLPSGSASNKITYRSSRKKIVSVNAKGIVTAKRKGKAVITVKTYNGKKAKLKVIVKKK